MSDLNAFLKLAAPDSTDLGTMSLSLGDDLPFCVLTLRSFHPENDEGGDLSITRRTFGVRAAMLSGEQYEYGDTGAGSIPAKLPTLLRIAARPRRYLSGDEIEFWSPDSASPIRGEIAQSDAAKDMLAVPEAFEDLRVDDTVTLPALRLTEGAAQLLLDLSPDTDLARLFDYDRETGTILGGVTITVDTATAAGKTLWPVTATPKGIVFDAEAMPDPTIGLSSNIAAASLKGRLRLEADASRGYRLRLLAPTETGGLADAIGRLQHVVTSLIESEASLRYRVDLRGEAPPLIWSLAFEDGRLGLTTVPDYPTHALAEIDPERVDLRMVTRVEGVGEGSALARVELSQVELHTTDAAFELIAYAGRPDPQPSYGLTYTYDAADHTWTTQFDGTFGHKSVALPLDRLRERLTTRYGEAGLLADPDETAPYAFFALRDGWLQYPLCAPDAPGLDGPGDPDMGADKTLEAKAALSGRLLFSATSGTGDDGGLPRALELSSTDGLIVTTTWRAEDAQTKLRTLEAFTLHPSGEAGSIYGFLFVADTSPSATEAVPDWTRGPAAVREVPLGFDSTPGGAVTFQWKSMQDGTSSWQLAFDLPARETDDAEAEVVGWVTMKNLPMITNYPMTRSAKSAAVPSRSRGLFPRRLTGKVRLRHAFTANAAPENDLPALFGPTDQDTAPGQPFGPAPVDPIGARDVQSALLPSLHGIEFTPDPDAPDWQFYATLRYDYPILDELFAWSDLPPVEPENAQTGPAPEAEGRRKEPVVTALHPDRLVSLWRDAEQRMQLTWTQDAVVTHRLAVDPAETLDPADKTDIALTTLAYPFSFEQSVSVAAGQTRLFGELKLSDDRDSLEAAAVGLGGVLNPEDDGVTLSDTSWPNGPDVHVTGYGIDQFPPPVLDENGQWVPDEGFLADARGTAFRTAPSRGGTLREVRRYAPDDTIDTVLLTTLPAPRTSDMAIGGSSTKVAFYVRDMPVVPERSDFRFAGMARARPRNQSDRQNNPVEGYRSSTGQAFDRENFALSLYEWRFFQHRNDGLVPDLAGDFDIPVGPFRFRPLRLIDAEFYDPGDPKLALEVSRGSILGSLSFRSDGKDPAEGFAFGADRIYDRDDLFIFRLNVSPAWQGAAVSDLGTDGQVGWISRDPEVSFTRRLPVTTKGDGALFGSVSDVDARFTLRFGYPLNGFEPVAATLRATLFGEDRTVTGGKVELRDADTLVIEFDDAADWQPALPASLRDVTLKATCSASGADQHLAIDGAIALRAKGDEGPALFSLASDDVRWLDLDLSEYGFKLDIDHEAGVLTLLVDADLPAGRKPLFGLPIGLVDGGDAKLVINYSEVLSAAAAEGGRVLHFLADLRVGDGRAYRLTHEVLSGAGLQDFNQLRLTWRSGLSTSPIQWPMLGSLGLDGAPDLGAIADGNLAPPDDPASGSPTRILTLGPRGEVLRHSFVFRLTDFLIDPSALKRLEGALLPLDGTLRGLAQVQHTLTGGGREKTWWSCDHVALTTAAAMKAEAGVLPDGVPQTEAGQALAFTPRHSHKERQDKTSPALRYRGAPEHNKMNHLPEGVARLTNANLSGWHDPAMACFVWDEIDQNAVYVVAVAPLWMLLGDGDRAHQINLPWAYGLPDGVDLQVPPEADPDLYRIPTMESWAAHAMAANGGRARIALSTRMREAELLAALSDPDTARPDLRRMLPASPGLFEPWIDDAPGNIETEAHHRRAPYFLRAMLALAAFWQSESDTAPVMSLAPDAQWAFWQRESDTAPVMLPAYKRPTRAGTRARLAVLRDSAAPVTFSPAAPISVDLIVLGQQGAYLFANYRQARPDGTGWSRPAELYDAAHRLVEDARYALFRNTRAGEIAGRSVAQPRDPLAQAGDALTPVEADIVASPALGWPMRPARQRAIMAPGFEAELALQSPEAGFAARSQRTLWPATAEAVLDDNWGRDDTDPIQSIALRFSEHVVFDRGAAPFPFDGPFARHLAPGPARRRSPVAEAELPRDQDGVRLGAPIMPPVVDRMLVGRRAGVLDASTASATVVAHAGKPALDAGWPGTGQPAGAGPVIGAQMRNPRSPVLPPHPDKAALFGPGLQTPEALRLSRRTFVSRADLDGDEALDAFLPHGQLSDTLRLTQLEAGAPEAVHDWRLSLLGAGQTVMLPSERSWSGETRLVLEFRAVDTNGAPILDPDRLASIFDAADAGEVVKRIVADLSIGSQTWPFPAIATTGLDGGIEITLHMHNNPGDDVTKEKLDKINRFLRLASADTPMQIDLRFTNTNGVSQTDQPELPPAGLAAFRVPVLLEGRGPRRIPVSAASVTFGDPSYDRALGSPTLSKDLRTDAERVRLAIDRQQANADTDLHLAFDLVNEDTGWFQMSGTEPAHPIKLGFIRVPFGHQEDGSGPPEQTLKLLRHRGVADDFAERLRARTTYVLRLADLVVAQPDEGLALSPGDRLRLKVEYGPPGAPLAETNIEIPIVAGPVIPPAPSVISFIEETGPKLDRAGPEAGRVRLHASAPLPSRIEYPDLLTDLGRGHVRRQALFVWHYGAPVAKAARWMTRQHLLKTDRSGGTQLPHLT